MHGISCTNNGLVYANNAGFCGVSITWSSRGLKFTSSIPALINVFDANFEMVSVWKKKKGRPRNSWMQEVNTRTGASGTNSREWIEREE